MLTRSKTNAKREYLKNSLRERCRAGILAAGQPVPGVRDLAAEFELSRDVVADLLKELVSEGVLYTVPRVGTFAGRPVAQGEQVFLMVYGPHPLGNTTGQLVKMGFEERIAELGAVPMLMETHTALLLQQQGEMPAIAGVLDYSQFIEGVSEWIRKTAMPNLPRVCYGNWPLDHPYTDFVVLDDERGGRQATEHLLSRGHRRIAFLAFHPEVGASPICRWSEARESGWRKAMAGAGNDCLSFHPATEVIVEDSAGIARVMQAPVRALLNTPGITGVVAANDAVANALLHGLQESRFPSHDWPAIVGFDGTAEVSAQLLTSLRMPWAEMGRAAADLLWNRANVVLERKPEVRRFPMRMIPRLTCRPNWSREAGQASIAVATVV